jgi:hypothetical protein
MITCWILSPFKMIERACYLVPEPKPNFENRTVVFHQLYSKHLLAQANTSVINVLNHTQIWFASHYGFDILFQSIIFSISKRKPILEF